MMIWTPETSWWTPASCAVLGFCCTLRACIHAWIQLENCFPEIPERGEEESTLRSSRSSKWTQYRWELSPTYCFSLCLALPSPTSRPGHVNREQRFIDSRPNGKYSMSSPHLVVAPFPRQVSQPAQPSQSSPRKSFSMQKACGRSGQQGFFRRCACQSSIVSFTLPSLPPTPLS